MVIRVTELVYMLIDPNPKGVGDKLKVGWSGGWTIKWFSISSKSWHELKQRISKSLFWGVGVGVGGVWPLLYSCIYYFILTFQYPKSYFIGGVGGGGVFPLYTLIVNLLTSIYPNVILGVGMGLAYDYVSLKRAYENLYICKKKVRRGLTPPPSSPGSDAHG
jgi:hypothetical protein